METRRGFLKATAISAVGTMLPINASSQPKQRESTKLKLGVASYSLRDFTQAKAINMAKRAGLEYICFKSMHMPLSSTPSEIQAGVKKVNEAGMTLYGGGVIYMKTKEEVDQAFEYAKHAQMSVIVGVPAHNLLEYTSQKVGQYQIKMAIHNHGPGDDLYPSPESIYERVKSLDPGLGICMDIGHTQRIGVDPIKAGIQYFDRLFDIHLKDVDKASPEGGSVEIGRGVIDIPGFLNMLVEKQYGGVACLEYEKDGNDPLPGLSESVGYVKGCLDSMA